MYSIEAVIRQMCSQEKSFLAREWSLSVADAQFEQEPWAGGAVSSLIMNRRGNVIEKQELDGSHSWTALWDSKIIINDWRQRSRMSCSQSKRQLVNSEFAGIHRGNFNQAWSQLKYFGGEKNEYIFWKNKFLFKEESNFAVIWYHAAQRRINTKFFIACRRTKASWSIQWQWFDNPQQSVSYQLHCIFSPRHLLVIRKTEH